MAARVCAHRTTVPVRLGDFGEFEMTVRRLAVEERAEIQDFHRDLKKKGRIGEAESDDVAAKMRKQLAGMVEAVSGVEFEWSPGEVETPTTIDALAAALERYEPLAIKESLSYLWAVCVEAQFLSPFSVRPSPSGGGS